MTKFLDWRHQAASFGVDSCNGHPVESLKIAISKYETLTGRDLSLNELNLLKNLVQQFIEKKKIQTIINKK